MLGPGWLLTGSGFSIGNDAPRRWLAARLEAAGPAPPAPGKKRSIRNFQRPQWTFHIFSSAWASALGHPSRPIRHPPPLLKSNCVYLYFSSCGTVTLQVPATDPRANRSCSGAAAALGGDAGRWTSLSRNRTPPIRRNRRNASLVLLRSPSLSKRAPFAGSLNAPRSSSQISLHQTSAEQSYFFFCYCSCLIMAIDFLKSLPFFSCQNWNIRSKKNWSR